MTNFVTEGSALAYSPAGAATLAYSPIGAARVIGCSRSWLYERLADGSLRARKIGSKTVIMRDDLLAMLDRARPATYYRTAKPAAK